MTINNCNGNGKVKRKDGYPFSSSSSSSPHPHAIVIPFPLQGHVNPMIELANQLVSKGVLVTLILTHDIQRRLNSTSTPKEEEEEEEYRGRRKGLRVVLISDGLPLEMDRMINYLELLVAMNGYGNDQFEKVLNGLGPVHCIIADSFLPNTKHVAQKQSIQWVAFWSQSLCVYTTYYHAFFHLSLPTSEVSNRQERTVALLNSLPGFPTMDKTDLPSFLQTEDIMEMVYQYFLLQFNHMKSTPILVNSFEELEEESLEAMRNKSSTNLTCIGPLLPPSLFKRDQNEEKKLMEMSGSSLRVEEWACMEWLNQKAPKSVLYISFGSLVSFPEEQTEEILLGVFESGVPFLWVARDMRKDLYHMFAKYNNSKTKTNGHQIGDFHNAMFVDWAPQLAVLSHVAVGGFLTHVGWNSTLESISCGVPMLTMPCFSDQTTTAKFASNTWKVALPLRPKHQYCGSSVITRDVIKEGLQSLFCQKSCVQDQACQLQEAAHKAIATRGSSQSNLQSFINNLFHLAS